MGKRVLSSTSKLPPELGGFPTSDPNKAYFFDAAGVLRPEDRLFDKPFTMGITAATPGDLSVVISTNTCTYDKIGRFVRVSIALVFTPTYTTASGNIILTGLPFTPDAIALLSFQSGTAFVWANTSTQLNAVTAVGSNNLLIQGTKSGAVVTNQTIPTFTSGQSVTLRFKGDYRTAVA